MGEFHCVFVFLMFYARCLCDPKFSRFGSTAWRGKMGCFDKIDNSTIFDGFE